MNTNEFIIHTLKKNACLKNFLDYMKDHGGCFVAGGSLTCIATGKQDTIEDYDVYFPNKEAAVEAIRYMKEGNPHVAFVSDKSITYVPNSTTKIQFIYYDFYPKAEDIFKHFDFSVNCIAYDCVTDSIITQENFWLNIGQRFLSINPNTKFPILSMLRLDKYKSRGYKTSRTEVLKLGLSISNLNINSWEEFKKQIGNSYGFTLADLSNCENEEFSIDKALDKIINCDTQNENIPMQTDYFYPHDAVDFVLLNKPIEVVEFKGERLYIDPYVQDAEDSVEKLIEKGILKEVLVDYKQMLEGEWFAVLPEDNFTLGKEYKEYGLAVYHKDKLPDRYYNKDKVIVKVADILEGDIRIIDANCLYMNKITPEKVICRVPDICKFQKGDSVEYKPRVKQMNSSGSTNEYNIEEQRKRLDVYDVYKFINDHVVVTGGCSNYAHNTFSGIILEGGENINATDLLHHFDGCGVPFGGKCSVSNTGSFSGSYNTD